MLGRQEDSLDEAIGSGFGGHDRDHPSAFHRGGPLDLGHVLQLVEDLIHDSPTLVNVGQLTASEEHIDLDLVFSLKELPGALDPDADVCLTGLRSDADFLELNLVRLLPGGPLLLFVLELAVVHDPADGRALVGGNLNEVKPLLSSQLHGLTRWS